MSKANGGRKRGRKGDPKRSREAAELWKLLDLEDWVCKCGAKVPRWCNVCFCGGLRPDYSSTSS